MFICTGSLYDPWSSGSYGCFVNWVFCEFLDLCINVRSPPFQFQVLVPEGSVSSFYRVQKLCAVSSGTLFTPLLIRRFVITGHQFPFLCRTLQSTLYIFFYDSLLISILSPGISTFTRMSVVRSIAFLNWSGSALILSHVL
jgi:hypothetical protein